MRTRSLFGTVLLSALVTALAPAQNGSQFQDWRPSSSEANLKPKLSCRDLRSLTGYEFSVITATVIVATADAPEYCRVSGQIMPEIRFEISLPASWNRRLYIFGNGGFAGEPIDSGRWRHGVVNRNRALQRGFAVAATNTGHDSDEEPFASFAPNRQKVIDYAFRAVHTTIETAKKLVRAYYGEPQSRAYFDGCSTGGRQGLISAQRFPQDFDGILVGAPVLYFTGTMISYAWIHRALNDAYITNAKLNALAERIYAVCDEKDGLKDGLIDDPRRCDFQPARDLPKCPDDKEGAACFTTHDVAALEKIYADVPSQGKSIHPGLLLGAEIAVGGSSGWNPWLVRDNDRPVSVLFGESFFRYMAFPETDRNYDLGRFDFDKDPARMTWIRQVLDATDPDVSRFQAHGGKMLMYYGWADPALNARVAVDYYEKASERIGRATKEFFRLFMVPGMFHCDGGVGVASFDAMTPLMNWVEKGVAPERIVGARIVQGKTVRTRPLCPFPQVAKYQGSGSIDEAANFACREP
jgi:hypothetical protein